MSFYTVVKTELGSKKYIICALEEMKRRGEIRSFIKIEKKDSVEIDRDGDIVTLSRISSGNAEIAGDNRVVQQLSGRLKQFYALEAIKDNLPLDFEIASETETAGEIKILLKG